MSTFYKTEKSLYQIKNILSQSEQIRKLLYNMKPSALAEDAPSISEIQNSITLVPYLEDEEGIQDSIRNSFIAVYPTNFVIENDGDVVDISIAAFCVKDYYLLNEQRIRPLAMIGEIERRLEGIKLEFAGKLELQSVSTQVVELGKFVGFISNWEVVNGKDTDF